MDKLVPKAEPQSGLDFGEDEEEEEEAYADSQQATEKAHSSHKKQSKPLAHSSKSLTMTLLYSIHSVQT